MTTPSKKRQFIILDDDDEADDHDLILLDGETNKMTAPSGQSLISSKATSATITAGSTPVRQPKVELPISTPTSSKSTTMIDLTNESTHQLGVSPTRKESKVGSVPVLWIDDDEDEASDLEILNDGQTPKGKETRKRSAFERSQKHKVEGLEDELIDLEALEDEDAEIRQRVPELRNAPVFHVDDVYVVERPFNSARRPSTRRKSSTIYPQRNPAIVYPFQSCNEIEYNGLTLRHAKLVELNNGDFLRIQHIIRNRETGQVFLRGLQIIRTNRYNGILEKKLNEVCMYIEVDADDPRDPLEQGTVEVDIHDVIGLRLLQTTNLPFPECTNFSVFSSQPEAREEGRLTLRWKYICKFPSAADRYNNRWEERKLVRLVNGQITEKDSKDIVPGMAAKDIALRQEWLNGIENRDVVQHRPGSLVLPEAGGLARANMEGSISLGLRRGSFPAMPSHKRKASSTIDLEIHDSKAPRTVYDLTGTTRKLSRMSVEVDKDDWPRKVICEYDLSESIADSPVTGVRHSSFVPSVPRRPRKAGEKLTYGDGFCGAGGTTQGAKMAGLKVLWGFDFAENPCSTWHHNFPNATCYQMAAHQFVSEAINGQRVAVDILHLSPPCQFFSPAHTINGRDDEMNTASLFAVLEVVRRTRPRVVTLEQTFGICLPRFQYYFNALINQFSALQFSVRWAIIPLAHWGLPQRRHRLIIIAACPGEVLPEMPDYIRSANGENGLRPFATVNEALEKVRNYLNRPAHYNSNVDTQSTYDEAKTPYDGNKILPRAMTTSGGQNYHPDGRRDFTIREYAVMQGFPVNYEFRGKAIKKQIGNAVPPIVAKHLFKCIIKALDEADGIAGPAENAIEL